MKLVRLRFAFISLLLTAAFGNVSACGGSAVTPDDAGTPADAGVVQDATSDAASLPALSPEPTPPAELARWGAMTAQLSSSEILVAHGYIGFNKSAPSADVFRVTRETDGFKTTTIKGTGDVPVATSRARLFASAASPRAYMGGGRTSGLSISDSTMYQLELSSGAWTKLALNPQPDAFLGCGTFMHPTKALGYQFGGASSSGYLAETWAFDFSAATPSWRLVKSTAAPSARFDPSVAVAGDGKHAYLFGGGQGVQPSAFYRNDVWEFDFETEQWTNLSPSGATGPTARRGAWMVERSGKLFIAAGEPASGTINDIWQYDIATKTWTQLEEAAPFDEAVFPLALTFNKTSWLIGGYVKMGLSANSTAFVFTR